MCVSEGLLPEKLKIRFLQGGSLSLYPPEYTIAIISCVLVKILYLDNLKTVVFGYLTC